MASPVVEVLHEIADALGLGSEHKIRKAIDRIDGPSVPSGPLVVNSQEDTNAAQ